MLSIVDQIIILSCSLDTWDTSKATASSAHRPAQRVFLLVKTRENQLRTRPPDDVFRLPLFSFSPTSEDVVLQEVVDFFEALLVFDILRDLDVGESMYDIFFGNLNGGLEGPVYLAATGEVTDGSDMRIEAISLPAPLSDVLRKPGDLISCFEIRF